MKHESTTFTVQMVGFTKANLVEWVPECQTRVFIFRIQGFSPTVLSCLRTKEQHLQVRRSLS